MERLKEHHKDFIRQGFRIVLKLVSWTVCLSLIGFVGYLVYIYGQPEKWRDYLNTKFISTFVNLAYFNLSLILFDMGLGRHTISRLIEINRTGVTKEQQYEQKRIALVFYGLYMAGTCYLIGLAI